MTTPLEEVKKQFMCPHKHITYQPETYGINGWACVTCHAQFVLESEHNLLMDHYRLLEDILRRVLPLAERYYRVRFDSICECEDGECDCANEAEACNVIEMACDVLENKR